MDAIRSGSGRAAALGTPSWRRSVPRDVIAGVSVAMVGIPQSLAYADLAGMDPVVGLYSGAVPPMLAAVFASSPWGTFVATVLLAPRLDIAVLIGIGLSVAVFLWRSLQLDIDVQAVDATLRFTPRGTA